MSPLKVVQSRPKRLNRKRESKCRAIYKRTFLPGDEFGIQ
jgi:hypothetical protein